MSDPDFKPEEAAPPQPPRPTAAQRQLEQDELYARQLAEHYQNVQRPPRSSSYDQRERNPPLPRRPNQQNVPHDELYDDRERSFFDDDLPVIRKNIEKGFLETQSKVNKWISDFKKRIDGDEDDPYDGPTRQEGPSQHYRQDSGPQNDRVYGIRKSADIGRRSGGRESYDADPHVLGDDFTALELRDDDGMIWLTLEYQSRRELELTTHSAPPARPSSGRPLANPDLFKTSVAPPQSGPVDEVDAIDRKLQKQTSPKDDVKQAKWQPLTSVAPNPESEDNDPFSLGDSDDEREKEDKTKDLREADTNRLKEAARNSVSAGSSDSAPKGLQASERSGSMSTKNKEAEELLAGKK